MGSASRKPPSTTPFSTSSSSLSPTHFTPHVGKITTQPGLRGRGEPGWSVRKQMSPLAAASASGESCTEGGEAWGGPSRGHSPPTSQASRSQLPCLALPRRGWFFQTQRFACAGFFFFFFTWELAVLPRPPRFSRCQTAAPARLSIKRPGGGRERLAGAHTTFQSIASATSASFSKLATSGHKRCFLVPPLEVGAYGHTGNPRKPECPALIKRG